MRQCLAILLLLITFIGCRPDPVVEGRKWVAEQIENVKLGKGDSVSAPSIDLLENAAKDPKFCKKLRKLMLRGKLSKYSNVPFNSFSRLEQLTLYDSQDTAAFLSNLPPNLKTLVMDLTDLTHAETLNDPDLTESCLTAIANSEKLESMFICPWNKRMTPIAARILPQSTSLKQLDIEWADENDISVLQKALPNCRVKLITEH